MFTIVLFSLLAFVGAAPQYSLSPYISDDLGSLERELQEEMFSFRKLWQELAKEMRSFEDSIVRTPTPVVQEKFEGNTYKIILNLPDFKESDISVKSGNGMIQISAFKAPSIHSIKSYTFLRYLPRNVDDGGNWSYENDVLTITLPLKDGVTTESTVDNVNNKETDHSREEIEKDDADSNMNADVGVETTVHPEMFTTVIPKSNVEATTYSEIMGNDIEFVPVRY